MNSSHETKLHLLFRMKGEIYQEADLNICLKNLKLQETDLVITSNSQMKKIKEKGCSSEYGCIRYEGAQRGMGG